MPKRKRHEPLEENRDAAQQRRRKPKFSPKSAEGVADRFFQNVMPGLESIADLFSVTKGLLLVNTPYGERCLKSPDEMFELADELESADRTDETDEGDKAHTTESKQPLRVVPAGSLRWLLRAIAANILLCLGETVFHDDESENKKRERWVNLIIILNEIIAESGPDGLRIYTACALRNVPAAIGRESRDLREEIKRILGQKFREILIATPDNGWVYWWPHIVETITGVEHSEACKNMRLGIFVDVHLNLPFPQLKDLKSAWEAVRPTLDPNEEDRLPPREHGLSRLDLPLPVAAQEINHIPTNMDYHTQGVYEAFVPMGDLRAMLGVPEQPIEPDSGTASSYNQYGTAPEWGKGESTTDIFRGIDQSYSW